MIWSFGGAVRARGGTVRVRCGAAGRPAPARSWARRRPAPPLADDPSFVIDSDSLLILGNFDFILYFV
jgi:hypothetical protein